MRDRRPVDELSLEELERVLVIRKRAARQERLRRFDDHGRRVSTTALEDVIPDPPEQHEAAQQLPPPEPPVTYDLTDDVPHFEDELQTMPPVPPRRRPRVTAPAPAAPRSRRRAAWDRLLLLIEVLGVVGIVGVLLGGAYLVINELDQIEALEQKSADIQREADALRATATPRAELSVSLSDYVLPGGHYSPDVTGGEYAFNLDEVPDSLRPVAVAQLTAPRVERVVPQANTSPVRIVIDTERVKVDASIYGGDDWYQLLKGVGHYSGSANPGEPGNMVLSAHNDIYGEIFRYIQYLNSGDEIRVQANNGTWYTYVVSDRFPVEPTDVWVLAPGSEATITLITCHPYRVDTQRMIVVGRLAPA